MGASVRRVPAWLAVLGGGAVGVALAIAVPAIHAPVRDVPGGQALHRTGNPPRTISLGGVRLLDTSGAVVPIAKLGEPAIVMINSVTCVWCEAALRDFAADAPGRVLSRLRVVTLEGAAGGARMLAHAGVKAGVVSGPGDEPARTMLSLQFPGTPVFVAVDSASHVIASLPGYPGRGAMRSWLAVMLGERASPVVATVAP